MSEWKPLYISMIILFIVGILLPSFMNSFVEINPDDVSGLTGGVINLIENGVDFFGSDIDVFGYLPQTIEDSIIEYISGFGYLPDWLQLFTIFIFSIGIFYTFIKLLPTT